MKSVKIPVEGMLCATKRQYGLVERAKALGWGPSRISMIDEDLWSQLQTEAATTWRSPPRPSSLARGTEPGRAWSDGFSLHAAVAIADTDRAGLERLCRYGARPAFAQDRLAWTDDGRISYRLKRRWHDGRAEMVLEPHAMLRRLCGIISPPRRHLVRYHGIFGSP